LKDRISVKEVSVAIKTVMAGGGAMSPNIARKVIQSFQASTASLATLSQREMEVLRCLSDGLMYKEIAPKLEISLNTVRTHVGAVYRKLHVQSRMDAARNYPHNPFKSLESPLSIFECTGSMNRRNGAPNSCSA